MRNTSTNCSLRCLLPLLAISSVIDDERERRRLLYEKHFGLHISNVRDEIIFLACGQADDGSWIEPPDDLLARYADHPELTVRPIRDAKYGRYTGSRMILGRKRNTGPTTFHRARVEIA